MSFLDEFDDFKTLPLHIGVTYKFFQMFKVIAGDDTGTPFKITWGSKASSEISEEMYAQSREFLKHQRASLRSGGGSGSGGSSNTAVSRGTCARLMWFWAQKILEMGVFTPEIRAEILRWLDACIIIVVE